MDDTTRLGENQQNPMTEYVVTRWYRCPELLLSPNRPYNEAIDLWSIGCILAELIKRKPLFPGKSHANQVQLIFEVVGYSSNTDLGFPLSAEASTFLDKRCRYRRQPFNKLFSDASSDAVKFIEALLHVDPSNRPTAAEALDFTFLIDAEVLHDYSKSYLSRPAPDFFDFEKEKFSVPALKEMIDKEVRLSSASLYRFIQQNRPPNSITAEIKECKITSSPRKASNIGESEDKDNSFRKSISNSNSSGIRRMSDSGSGYMQPGDESDGPVSQMATQVRGDANQQPLRGASNNNPFRKSDSSSSSMVARSRGNSIIIQQSGNKITPVVMVANNDHHLQSEEVEAGEEDPILPIDDVSSNILTSVRNDFHSSSSSIGSGRYKPKTPSPKKMEQILQKDLSNKKRFLMQGMAKQKEQLEQDQANNALYTARNTFPAPEDDPTPPANSNAANGSKKFGRFIPMNPSSSNAGLMSQLQMTYQNLSSRMGSSRRQSIPAIDSGAGYSVGGSHRSSAIMNTGSNVIHGEHDKVYGNKKN